MARDGAATRERILDAAMQLVMEQGYGGMTVDQVIAAAGITKGAFFHHFKTKNDLARALLERYVRLDDALLHDLMDRAEKLSRDPLQQYLIFVGLMEEALRAPRETAPGCLVASYIYQLELFTPDTREAVIGSFDEWARVLTAKLNEAFASRTPKIPVTPDQLYTNLMSLFEGGVIMSRLYRKGDTLADQLAQHRNYVELLFDQHDRAII
jgi:TetR/AcrR family transcriptional repressor of nem operon